MRSGRLKQMTTSFGPDHSHLFDAFSVVGSSYTSRISTTHCPVLISRDINVSFTIVYFTLVLYDYTLTISREIELFWKRPERSWMFALFIANRYITILGHAPFLVYLFWSPKTQSDYRV
ncbi:hypothetical protein SCLCIDRAFT_599763 [Scleroderma citrinum Foug A]|uniref:DUF6533 domain-containing protein n=1 Tax=Scleroderma citrinum Foug A TaxID=1036808 RepID=A0A0C2ZTP0_9AGAM|nr:hypothetical protein SCLCIDRAFT_599763 [Scleroderma citrinum Foug A]